MSLPSYLANIKSPGIYRFVFDKSVVPTDQRSSIRLVVGYSEKGPFNTPVYIGSATEFINIFGNISRRMERKGIFFNRLALQALDAGPILALNLKPFNSNLSKPEYSSIYSFNASDLGENKPLHKNVFKALVAATNRGTRDQSLVSIYDTNRFWKVDENRLHEVNMLDMSAGLPTQVLPADGKDDYIRIAMTSSKEDSCTVFIRPYIPTGYNVKVSDWYSSEVNTEMPPYMEVIKDHYLNEYFAEVYVFKGDMRKSELFSYKGTLGSHLPIQFNYLTDKNANPVYWDAAKTKPVLYSVTAYDEDRNPAEYFLIDKAAYDAGVAANPATTTLTLITQDTNGQKSWLAHTGKTINELTLQDGINIDYTVATDIKDGSTDNSFVLIGDVTPTVNQYIKDINGDLYTITAVDAGAKTFTVKLVDPLTSHYSTNTDENYLSWQPFCLYDETNGLRTNPDYTNLYGEKADALSDMSDVSTSNFIGRYSGIMFPSFQDASGSFISLDYAFNSDYNSHKMLMHMNESLLDDATDADLNDNEIYDPSNPTETAPDIHGSNEGIKSPASYVHALCSSIAHAKPGKNGNAYEDYTVDDWDPVGKSINGLYMEGYVYNSISRADKGRNLVNKIYKVMAYKGIREALTNNVDVDYHYLIDTFQGYPGLSMKSQFSQIAKAKDNCLALLSFPPMDDIMKHCGYSKYDGGFDMKNVTKAENGISLPAESLGASYIAFYTQLTMTDGSSKFVAPSTALVSNLFMYKINKRLPYYIVAGPNYGMINYNGVVGPDYNYARADMDVLNTMGVNCIVHIPRYGVVINGNQTAKQTPVSALSKVHIRELVIFIQDEIQDMLRGYQWELNTSTLRDKVKAKADTILGLIQANGGVYAFTTKCDSENNTPEVIDNDMLIIDIAIEAAHGTEKCVQTLTLYRTGALSSTTPVSA